MINELILFPSFSSFTFHSLYQSFYSLLAWRRRNMTQSVAMRPFPAPFHPIHLTTIQLYSPPPPNKNLFRQTGSDPETALRPHFGVLGATTTFGSSRSLRFSVLLYFIVFLFRCVRKCSGKCVDHKSNIFCLFLKFWTPKPPNIF